jgi:biopolymer transport protein ExbB/TolQ
MDVSNAFPGDATMVKKRSPFVQRAIALPSSLNDAMTKATEAVDWSAIARQAFETELERLDAKNRPEAVAPLTERLRKSDGTEAAAYGKRLVENFWLGYDAAKTKRSPMP